MLICTAITFQNREIAELQAAMKEIQKEGDRIRNKKAITKVGQGNGDRMLKR